jgi:hypothetical protein
MLLTLALLLQDPLFEERKVVTIPDGCRASGMQFSGDARRVVFDFQTPKGNTVWIDQGPVEGWDEAKWPHFAPDGRCAHKASEGKKQFVVLDGRTGPAFDSVSRPGALPDGKWNLIQGDGKTPLEFDLVYSVEAAPDGRTIVCTGKKSTLVCRATVGDRAYEVEGVMSRESVIGPGGTFGWTTMAGEGEKVWLGDKLVGEYDQACRLRFSPQGLLAFIARRKREYFLVVDGREFPACDFVQGFDFRPDGGAVVWLGESLNRYRLHVGGWKSPEFDYIVRPLRFSKDGKKVAFGAAIGRDLWWMVLEIK